MRLYSLGRGSAWLAVLALAAACGQSPSPTMVFPTPQMLVDCAQPPPLQARLWISGSADPCLLAVDVAASIATGSCETAPGIVRRFTLDWFVDVRGREVLLAQAQKEVDLRNQQESLTLTYAAEDIVVTGCLDMSVDSFNGAELVDVDGVLRPVCDLDDDGVDYLGEACAGNDPSGGV